MSTFVLSRWNGRLTLRLQRKALIVALILATILLSICAASLMSGSYPLTLREVLATLAGDPPVDTAETIVWQFRFPRTLVAGMAGALFGLSGAILQYVTRNPLADPSLVGVSQGASLAVVTLIVIYPEVNIALRPLIAFGGALLVAALIQWIAMQRTGGATMRFILTGIGVAAFISAVTTSMLTYGNIDQAQSALGWLAGSIHAVGWGEVWSLAACLIVLTPCLIWSARYLSALRMGPEVATGLGVPIKWGRIGMITLSVALAAFAVAAVGPLGFVGLVAPHLARRLAHSGVGQHLLLTALTGAVMVGLADFIGRTAFAPIQIPAGILTAILGVPVFLFIIVKQNTTRQL
ncbi:FecCD family ABC transporter permease [Roseobacter sp. CCS2]|uniref:FecCD family ABC transporter permease n=1 Tax=Roseobacter sp. CCS2 TaxID=391593 RepID=UPI0000F4031B|nr:iron ABC transporter permease [Roseobacter sp. CCS2]EBA13656.1 iron(III) dicitrate transport system permease protein [Roseobacter sp. CCS2]